MHLRQTTRPNTIGRVANWGMINLLYDQPLNRPARPARPTQRVHLAGLRVKQEHLALGIGIGHDAQPEPPPICAPNQPIGRLTQFGQHQRAEPPSSDFRYRLVLSNPL